MAHNTNPALAGIAASGLWQVTGPVRLQIAGAMTLSVLAGFSGMAALLCLALSLDGLLASPGTWPLWPLVGTIAAATCGYLLRLISFNQSHYAAFRLEKILRHALVDTLTRAALGDVQQLGSGALAKIIQDDVKSLHIFVADSTPLCARALAIPLLTLVLMLYIEWRLALSAALVLMVGTVVLMLARRNATEMHQRYNQTREQVSAAVVEFVQAMPVVRNFDSGSTSFGRYQRALLAWREVLTEWYRLAGFPARFSFAVLNALPTLMVMLGTAWFLMRGEGLDFAHLTAALLLAGGMAEAVMPMMMLSQLVNQTRMSLQRIDTVLQLPAQPVPHEGRVPADASVTFEQVCFNYGGRAEHPALRDISFTLAAGSTVALVGPSGAGKTTIARLIPRFHDVSGGRILIGGVDVREMRSETLMQQVAFVFQENFLFNDSVLENIRLGQPGADRAAVIAAAKAAQAHDFIGELPLGYDTPVGERGTSLSGGQRQRIAIARALLQARPILVLDEATAYADPETEASLIQALSVLKQGRTVIMVVHRLSLARDADQILVFEQGRLVESGQHAELLARTGCYARLWQEYKQTQAWPFTADEAQP
ncbi:ATP-binding cassette subfamily B protein [Enterobacter sp. BIGb0383]|nr:MULTISPECIES: ABC transporter ATP-binding protein [unclassified Enterobacter]ROP62749.1 ATP-binding cassette subfamily B protein [Enterobacter sp. BIGb0383]ROS12910.1 ATP-binding cassette subfamily B protein [Enterobacter sp. BIGb0359]